MPDQPAAPAAPSENLGPVLTTPDISTPTPTAVPPTPPATGIPPTLAKPEVVGVAAGGQGSPNKTLMIISALVLVVVLAIFGVFIYLKSAKVATPPPAENTVSLSPTPTSAPVVAMPEQTLDQMVQSLDTSLNRLDVDKGLVESGLNDKSGDLSEN